MNIAIIDCRADDRTIYSLENVGMQVIPTIKIDSVYDAIATHADIQIHYLGNNRFICAPEVFEHYKSHLPYGFELICGSKSLSGKYPHDIAYNAAVLKKFVICNAAYTATEILSEYKSMSKSKEILNVRQGYSKCSICIVNGRAIITSDQGIAAQASANGIDVLEIEPGHIKLRNLNYGFVGGATGLIRENVLAVNGDVNTHPDSNHIKKFCKKHGVELLELKDGILEDIGTIISNFNI
ncbi:MAG: DUF6873 family GME fold protein [Hominilimicola sp.]